MKRIWATALGLAAMGSLAACSGLKDDDEAATSPETETPGAVSISGTAASEPSGSTVPAQPATDGAPAFAVVYPGATIQADPVVATGPEGPGGLVTYLTDAPPEAVIAFHRERAEAAGLSSVMAMNQGDARAYGAAKARASLQVVAAPTPEGRTSVQLSWSAAG
ncbi:hypothetical protein [Brevundimonas bacteroides]|uniref:hypothetical protein n=1 Tax=Brevundimonas bacteroides TaxID=74311 RepID=UPI000495F4B2|nr:hypothetical protein [Brevundimonas bacteroides]